MATTALTSNFSCREGEVAQRVLDGPAKTSAYFLRGDELPFHVLRTGHLAGKVLWFLRVSEVANAMAVQRAMEFPCRAVLGAQRPVLHVLGGHDGRSLSSHCWRMDPSTGNWQEVAPLPSARSMAAAAAVGGRLYVVGGFDGAFLANVEVFDPSWNEWSPGPPMSQRRGGLGLIALRGHLFACGGRDGDIYHSSAECFQLPEAAEPSGGRWHPLPALLRPRCYPAAARFAEGVWLCGGLTRSSNGTGGYLASTEYLALDATSWCRGPQLLGPRASAVAAELRIGLVVCGGCAKEGPFDTAEVLASSSSPSFQALPKLHGFRNLPAAAMVMSPSCAPGEFFRQRLLIFGGFSGKKHLKTVEAFNEETCSWELVGDLPEPILAAAATAVCMPLS